MLSNVRKNFKLIRQNLKINEKLKIKMLQKSCYFLVSSH